MQPELCSGTNTLNYRQKSVRDIKIGEKLVWERPR